MRILGIDYGHKRVGLALSDETAMLAQPLGYLPGGTDEQVCQAVLELVQHRQVGTIVVGLPLQLDGRSSPQTERTRRFITALQQLSPVPVARWDERLTTAQAERVLIEGGVRRRDRREKVDQLAAQLMLQSYLDAKGLPGFLTIRPHVPCVAPIYDPPLAPPEEGNSEADPLLGRGQGRVSLVDDHHASPSGSSSMTQPRHFKLTIAYDGTAYGGWQLQPNVVTVQQKLEEALARIAGAPVRVHGSGRTDAGVHARGQVANCSFRTRHATTVLRRALNANLPVDIRVTRVQATTARFHARFSAKAKEYRYQIDVGPVADPFQRAYAWQHPQPLDLAAMRRAARWLKGRHDFRALSANPLRPVDRPVRTIRKLTVTRRGPQVTIAVVADGFLYKMVRSIVGALVKAGEGKLTLAELTRVVGEKKRTALIETAPARGLCLWRVLY